MHFTCRHQVLKQSLFLNFNFWVWVFQLDKTEIVLFDDSPGFLILTLHKDQSIISNVCAFDHAKVAMHEGFVINGASPFVILRYSFCWPDELDLVGSGCYIGVDIYGRIFHHVECDITSLAAGGCLVVIDSTISIVVTELNFLGVVQLAHLHH